LLARFAHVARGSSLFSPTPPALSFPHAHAPQLSFMIEPLPSTTSPQQQEIPLAYVRGQPVLTLPKDLYIPPDALAVALDAFEGPLDLLLYLIRRENLDILDIPISVVTRQYIDYIETMHELNFELAAEYLVMAAILAEIKSRMLLPRPPNEHAEEDLDPRADLIRRLQEYERFKQAAQDLDALPRLYRDTQIAKLPNESRALIVLPPPVAMQELLLAMHELLQRADLITHHAITREPLSVRERMAAVLAQVDEIEFTPFHQLFTLEEGRRGVVVTFLAILELLKEGLLEMLQTEAFGAIYVRAPAATAGAAAAAMDYEA
jgi:segregation and condensation protein A